jgi:hypothetical protein
LTRMRKSEEQGTYAAHYIVLTDGALFGVGLEKVDFAEELVLVVFECSDHDG